MTRKPYPSDISEEEWHFVAPYLTLMDVNAPQRRHDLREVFNALRWLARAGAPWRLLPHDLPPWQMVYQQFRRWDEAAGPSGLRSFIDRLNAGDAFEAVYRTARLGPALTPPPTRSAPARCARCG